MPADSNNMTATTRISIYREKGERRRPRARVENMEDIVATLSVETRRVAVRSTARLDEDIGVTRNAPGRQAIIEGSQDGLRVTRNDRILRGNDLSLPCSLSPR